MLLPIPILTEALPSDLVVTMVGGMSVGSTSMLDFEPTVMSAGVTVGGAFTVLSENVYTMVGGMSAGGNSAIEFHDPLNYVHMMVGGATVGGATVYDGPEFMVAACTVGAGTAIFFYPEDDPNYQTATIEAAAAGASALLSGRMGVFGSIAGTAPMARAALVGGPQSIRAKASMAKAVITAAGGAVGSIVARAPRASATLTAFVTGAGVVTARAPMARVAFTVSAPAVATITASAKSAKSVFTAYMTVTGTVTARTPMATTEFSGGSGIVATIIFEAPMAKIYLANNRTLSNLVNEVVANTVTGAVTEYQNYGFDSFAIVGGTTYAAGADGIYELDSAGTDNTAPIYSYFETGAISFSSEYLKRIEGVYAAYRTTGDIRVSVRTDEGKQYIYNMKYDQVPTIKQRRVPTGKGLKGKYWQFKFENVGGCSFGFDTFNILAHETVRRIGA